MDVAAALYDWGIDFGRRVLRRTPFMPDKMRRGIEGRRELVDRIESWARDQRGESKLAWFHAPSVGEGLQTRPVIEALRAFRPELQVFYTYYSPSAVKLAQRMPVDYADYMPFDLVADLMRVMEAVKPDVLVFGKLDVWPNATRVARWRDVPLALVNATVAPNSSRLRWPARRLLRGAYARLDAVGAISMADAARLALLGVPADRIEITGDARFDQVWARAQAVDRSKPPLAALGGHAGPTLVAGSTWPEGEERLVPAIAAARRAHPELRTIIAPHEPTPDHLQGLEARLRRHGLGHVRLSAIERADEEPREVVVVDRVGVLGELYALADVAYVGGGFGRRGLHSVLEPAALGVPSLFGPHHANAREASELIARRGAIAAEDGAALESALAHWLSDPAARAAAGRAASNYVQANLGAGRRNAELVLRLLAVSP